VLDNLALAHFDTARVCFRPTCADHR